MSLIGKQSEEERKVNKRKYKRTEGALERAVLAKRLKRMKAKQIRLEETVTKAKEELETLGMGHIPMDDNGKALLKLLKSPKTTKLEFLQLTTGVPIDADSPEDRVNRLVYHAHSMKVTHKMEGRRPFTLQRRFQEEFRNVAMSAEQVSQGALENFFGRLIREKTFSVKKISQCQDRSMRSQLSGGSLETLRTLENTSKYGRGIIPSRSAVQKYNYTVECGATKKYVVSKETADGSIFRITVSCILIEMLSCNKRLIQKFGCTAADIQNESFKPTVIKLAATIDGGALTCHKGFIIYGIKFVQKEFVNLILGRPIDYGEEGEEDVDGIQSVRMIQMLGFCQGKDDLVHNKALATEFFSELHDIEGKNNGYYYMESIDRYFAFTIIYIMDMKAIWTVCGSGGGSYHVRFFCNHCPCRPASASYQICADCSRRADLAPGKVCRHQPEWTEQLIDELVQECVQKPSRMLWSHKPPQSDASTQVWRDYVKQVLRKDDGRTMDKTRAQKLAQEWMLEYDMLEVDSSMTTTTSYKWKVMFENLRVRGIDTSSLRDLDNGTPGIPVVGGERYEDILQEASLIDLHISHCTPSSLEEVRLVLKYVMYHGNRLSYAEHVTSNQERMCTKIENVMECGMHMDNRIGHNQFNKTVKYLVENATRVVIHDKLERISDVVVRALSHLPLEAEEAPLSATYALKYDDKKGEIEPLKII